MNKALAIAIAFATTWTAFASPSFAEERTQATFLITGLHCPPCTRTVEASLLRTNGVKAVSVDWRTKNARIEFDEAALPAQVLANRIVSTPHMMGRGMQYGAWLALRVEGIKDPQMAESVKAALLKVPGVANVALYPAQEAVALSFNGNQKLSTAQLVESLAAAGIKASNL